MRYFGEEGLAEAGATVARLVPNPWDFFMELELDVLAGSNEVSFGGGSAKDLLYNLHYRSFFDLTAAQSLNLGASYSTGVNRIADERSGRRTSAVWTSPTSGNRWRGVSTARSCGRQTHGRHPGDGDGFQR